jgi:AcrR family transcriptional regulator
MQRMPRKEPRQARSRQMRQDILDASIRVLRRHGAQKFTTPRVAEAAGVSVGSLYQYFPNKQALLFAVHLRVIEDTWARVQTILDHPRWGAREKVRRIAVHFFRVEAGDVGEMGASLSDIEPLFEDEPAQRALERAALRRFRKLTPSTFEAELLVTVLKSVGKSVAARKMTRRQRDRWARRTADLVSLLLADGAGG